MVTDYRILWIVVAVVLVVIAVVGALVMLS